MAGTTTIQEPAFFEVMKQRRSVRNYDPNFKIERDELKALIGDAVSAPSSNNMQSWRFLVIDSPEQKEVLLPIANNQQQVADASAVIVVLGDLESYKMVETITGRAVEQGYMTEEAQKAMVERTVSRAATLPRERLTKIAYTDGGLVAMQLMLAAKARGYDTVPMGGFNAEKLFETFGISERYVSVLMIAIGKALSPGRPTVRLTADEVTSFNHFSL